MTGNTQHITQLLFGTPNLEEVSLDELRELVGEFPSFTAGHYLLSKKMKSTEHEGFLSETQKTALYFTNPFLLQGLLDDNTYESVAEPVLPAASKVKEEIFELAEPYHEPIQEFKSDVVSEIIIDEPAEFTEVTEINAYAEPGLEIMETIHISDEKFPEDEEIPEAVEPYHEPTQEFNRDVVSETIIDSSTAVTDPIEINTDLEPRQEMMETIHTADEKFPVDEAAFHFHEPIEDETRLDENPAVVQHPEADQGEEPKAAEPTAQPQRTHFFWEKEFQARAAQTEPPVEITQTEQEDQFPENPAFSLLETEVYPQHEPDLTATIEDKESAEKPLTELTEEKEVDAPESISFSEASPGEAPEEIFKDEEFILSSASVASAKEAWASPEPAKEAYASEESAPAAQPFETVRSSFAKASEDNEELKFEPYHTIDYFASLGIKFIQEENPTDKFGKQLKSFTAWLKTMKRSPTSLLDTEMNAMTEATIQDIAEHSIEEKEVLTEAMAEVLAMQGKLDRAIELYHKLSLLNPSKRAYFAARIEHFKVN